MRRILTITLSALMLAGCATGYDKSAMRGAGVAAHQATDSCKARRTANDIKTWSEFEACELTAARAFFTAINMKKMDAFEAYASSMQALAADRDAHRATDRQARSRGGEIVFEFFASCECKPNHQILAWDVSPLYR
jgi:hypothetical protein